MAWEIVIAGGGFGGFYAARALERLLPANSAKVTLVNEANFMLYTPLLPGAAGATLGTGVSGSFSCLRRRKGTSHASAITGARVRAR